MQRQRDDGFGARYGSFATANVPHNVAATIGKPIAATMPTRS
jgi:hypothetical protein